MRILDMENRLEQGIMSNLAKNKHRLELNAEIMKRLSPLNKLSSGFSYVQNEDGKCLKKVTDFHKDEKILIHVSDGMISANVLETEHINRE